MFVSFNSFTFNIQRLWSIKKQFPVISRCLAVKSHIHDEIGIHLQLTNVCNEKHYINLSDEIGIRAAVGDVSKSRLNSKRP